jgi:hypothetical protein
MRRQHQQRGTVSENQTLIEGDRSLDIEKDCLKKNNRYTALQLTAELNILES